MPQSKTSEREGVDELVPIFCGLVPMNGDRMDCGNPEWFSHSVFRWQRLRQRMRQQHDRACAGTNVLVEVRAKGPGPDHV